MAPVKVRSPGSATVINAIATGKGSAFGIELYVEAEVDILSLDGSKVICHSQENVDTALMEICTRKVLEKFNVEAKVRVETISTLPVASGLSSSSATSNAVTMGIYHALIKEGLVEYNSLDPMEMLNMGIDASLEAGVTITGAFDDASASFYGGVTVTDNIHRKIIRRDEMEGQNILIYMPNKQSPTAQSDVKRMKLLAPWVKLAFNKVLNGDLYHALTLNGILYCAALGFNADIALDALEAGALAAGLSGTGPSFVALSPEENVDAITDAWKSYPGQVICTFVDNQGTRVTSSG